MHHSRRPVRVLAASLLVACAAPIGLAQSGAALSDDATTLSVNGDAIFTSDAGKVTGLRTLEVGAARVVLFNEATLAGATPMYAISLDGKTFTQVQAARPELKLRDHTFDPNAVPIAEPEALQVDPANRAYIVQFETESIPPYIDALGEAGLSVRKYLPWSAFIVEGDADAIAQANALGFVRSLTPYRPVFKVDGSVLADRFGWNPGIPAFETTASMPDDAFESYNVQVLARGLAQKQVVADAIGAMGGVVEAMIPDGFIIRASLNKDQLAGVAKLSEVQFIDRWSPPQDDMNVVLDSMGGTMFHDTLGLTGQGVNGEVMDGNVLSTHNAFQSPPMVLHGPKSGNDSHGTGTFGITFGDGTANASGTGMLPGAQGIFADYSNLNNRYTHTAELLSGDYEAVFQSNSWGDFQTTQYNTISSEMDDILFLHDIIITQSQSNTGSQASRPQAWAKNIVAIGGINHFQNTDDSDDCWCGDASIGPASDGRFKPDLVGYYDDIFTTDDNNNNAYGSFCCTSAATPMVAGHFGLFFQMWHEGFFPGFGEDETVFRSRPPASTARAIMVNSARAYSFFGQGADLGRNHQGWGLPDLTRLYDARNDLFIVPELVNLAPFETATYLIDVAEGDPMRATMVYKDPNASPGAGVHRINDLNLKLTSPSGLTYWGNSGLHQGNASTRGGSPDELNVIENVFVNNPELGTWTVEVIAEEVNEDAVLSTPETDVTFSLVVHAGDPIFIPLCQADINDDNVVDSVDLNLLLAQFGTANSKPDIDGSGLVDSADLNIMLGEFGNDCP